METHARGEYFEYEFTACSVVTSLGNGKSTYTFPFTADPVDAPAIGTSMGLLKAREASDWLTASSANLSAQLLTFDRSAKPYPQFKFNFGATARTSSFVVSIGSLINTASNPSGNRGAHQRAFRFRRIERTTLAGHGTPRPRRLTTDGKS